MFIHCRELKGNSRTVGQSGWWSNMGGLEAEKNREETDCWDNQRRAERQGGKTKDEGESVHEEALS